MAPQPEEVDILVELDLAQDLDQAISKPLLILDARNLVVDPIGVGIELGIAGEPGFLKLHEPTLLMRGIVLQLLHRAELQR